MTADEKAKKQNYIFSWFDPPPCPGEENSGEVVVEREGYIPPNVEIQELIAAGEKLDVERGTYEFGADEAVPDNYVDPYRSPNADVVDFGNAVGTLAYLVKQEREAKAKLDKEKADADAKAAADAEAKRFDDAVEKAAAKKARDGIS